MLSPHSNNTYNQESVTLLPHSNLILVNKVITWLAQIKVKEELLRSMKDKVRLFR